MSHHGHESRPHQHSILVPSSRQGFAMPAKLRHRKMVLVNRATMHAVLNSSVDGGHIEEFGLRQPCLKKGSLYHRNRGLSVSTAGMVAGGTNKIFLLTFNCIPKKTVIIYEKNTISYSITPYFT